MLQDLRYAFRVFRKSRGFAAVVILTLAFGIGANTAVFSVVHGVVLQTLPYRQPDRLVDILDASIKDPNLAKTFDTYSDFEEYARYAHSFEKISFATWAAAGAVLTGRGPARNVLSIPVSEDFFSMLGVAAARGRTFERADLARGCSVVLSDRFWRTTLGGAAGIVGQTLELDHRPCTVLGVMPARFEFYPRPTQLWMLFTPDDPRPRDQFPVLCFARLKPGVTVAQAQAELTPLHKEIHQGDWQHNFLPAVDRLQDEFSFLAGRNLRATLGLLLAAVTLVLLIACLNVANLLLARGSARAREFAVRAALGSGRARLIRQLLVEAALLAVMGGAAGVVVAFAIVKYFVHANPIELPVGSDVSLNLPVLAVCAMLTMAAALVFGFAPAWSGSSAGVGNSLRAAGRGSIHAANRPLMRGMIAAEISLSLVLLAGATLLMKSVLKMSGASLGFDPQDVVVSRTSLPAQRYAAGADKLRFYDQLERRLRVIPGVESVAVATVVPPSGMGSSEVQVEGKARTEVQDVGQDLVSEDYFRVLRIALRRGRSFNPQDGPDSTPVAVINEKLAREYFHGSDPIGQRVRILGNKEGPWVTIVGVVATEKHPELMREMSWRESAALYRPIQQEPGSALAIVVRLRGRELDTGREIERALGDVDKDIPLARFRLCAMPWVRI